MRMKTLVLVICLLFSWLAAAQAKPENKAKPKAKAKTAAAATTAAPDKALFQKVLDAWSTMNTDEVAKYYDQAPGDVFYDVAPVKYNGWAEYASGVKNLFGTLQSIKFTANDDAVVHRSGKLTWGTATVKTVMTDKSGKTSNLDCRWTVVWEKKGANWVIVHDHFSAPLEVAK